MIKLNASYSKKVPADQEYSSKSFLACVEVELPTGASAMELQKKIHDTFALVKASNKQIKFILDLGKAKDKGLVQLNTEVGQLYSAETIYELTKKDASRYGGVIMRLNSSGRKKQDETLGRACCGVGIRKPQ